MSSANPSSSRPPPEEPRSVPGIGGPGSEETAPDGRSALRLHAGISVIGTVLSLFVVAVFLFLLDSVVPAIAFAVIALASFAWGAWAVLRLRRTRDAVR